MTTFTIHTLGCKVNFYESEWIREQLLTHGASEIRDTTHCPDWIIINTCTVTGRADRQSRQLIYRAARQYPETRVIVTGCYADRDPETLRTLPNVAHVVPNAEKLHLPETLLTAPAESPPTWMALSRFEGHVRAYLMVQNGCNARCAYCIIPKVRGRSRSKPIETVLRELTDLEASGHPEVVLCGIHLGLYGRDLSPPQTLSDLLKAIEDHPFRGNIRISSLEPMEFQREIIEITASSEKICPHFHIPLQNGDGGILKRMNRPYTPESFQSLIQDIKSVLPDCTLGSDVMVGFPGETEKAFKQTYHFISELPLSYLHVFPYSERPGTLSATFPDKIPESVKKARASQLLELARQKRGVFFSSWVGKTDTVVFEQRKGDFWHGKSAHYLPVRVKSSENLLGQVFPVHIASTEERFVVGEL